MEEFEELQGAILENPCPPGKVLRRSYERKFKSGTKKEGYYRRTKRGSLRLVQPKKSATHVRASCVRPSRRESKRLERGDLSRHGYTYKDPKDRSRRGALALAIESYGPKPVYKYLKKITKLSKIHAPDAYKIFASDLRWVKRSYDTGGEKTRRERPEKLNLKALAGEGAAGERLKKLFAYDLDEDADKRRGALVLAVIASKGGAKPVHAALREFLEESDSGSATERRKIEDDMRWMEKEFKAQIEGPTPMAKSPKARAAKGLVYAGPKHPGKKFAYDLEEETDQRRGALILATLSVEGGARTIYRFLQEVAEEAAPDDRAKVESDMRWFEKEFKFHKEAPPVVHKVAKVMRPVRDRLKRKYGYSVREKDADERRDALLRAIKGEKSRVVYDYLKRLAGEASGAEKETYSENAAWIKSIFDVRSASRSTRRRHSDSLDL